MRRVSLLTFTNMVPRMLPLCFFTCLSPSSFMPWFKNISSTWVTKLNRHHAFLYKLILWHWLHFWSFNVYVQWNPKGIGDVNIYAWVLAWCSFTHKSPSWRIKTNHVAWPNLCTQGNSLCVEFDFKRIRDITSSIIYSVLICLFFSESCV